MTPHLRPSSLFPVPSARWLAWVLWCCLWCGLCWGGGQARAQPTTPELVLSAGTPSTPVWPALRRYQGQERLQDWTDASLVRDRFQPQPDAHASLGLQPEPVWLHLPLRVSPGADGVWVLDIDYPPLNRVSLFLVRDGMLVAQDTVGNGVAHSERHQPGRTPAAQFTLDAGRYDLWLQVQTSGAMVLPMTLSRAAVFHGRALDEQMLQGLLTGLALCLLAYSLAQWLTLRDSLFLKYSLLLFGSLCFSLHLFGVGRQYVWGAWPWVEQHAAGLSALAATAGSFLFIEHSLRGPDRPRWWRRAMWSGALVCVVVALSHALDVLSLRAVTALMTLLGVMPALMGLRGAFRRMRAGDPVGLTLPLAWAVYALATLVVIAAIRGWVPLNFWTQHAFQFGATLDMLLFMRVLGLRTQAIERAALEVTRERDVMQSLAHTDPLTGLANRRGLNAALQAALPLAGPHRLLAVFVLDLDGFKPVNDHHGHDVGDALLVAVAQRLRAHLRAADVVARVGGDEFVLLAAGLPDEAAAHDLGLKLRDAFDQPFDVSCEAQLAPVRVGLTLGYALAPTDGREAALLIKRADAAMYAGKQAGKHRLVRASAPV